MSKGTLRGERLNSCSNWSGTTLFSARGVRFTVSNGFLCSLIQTCASEGAMTSGQNLTSACSGLP